MNDTIDEAKPVDKTTLPPVDNDIKPPKGLTPAQEAKWEADYPHPAGTDYDAPPKQWVPGTVVPKDTAPEDMTDAEYIQWCFENRMPYWAIKKEIYLRKPSVLEQLEPASAELGSPSFELYVHGDGFVPDSVVVFAGVDQQTMWHSPKLVSAGVNMSVSHEPGIVEVSVRTGALTSGPAQFELVAAEGARKDEGRDVDSDRDEDDDGRDGDDRDDDERDDDGKPAKKAKARKRK